MTPDQAHLYLQEILDSARREGDYPIALRTLELMCKLSGNFDKQVRKLKLKELTEAQIQGMIDQLNHPS